jgi:iron-sulfur cluster insertion protein
MFLLYRARKQAHGEPARHGLAIQKMSEPSITLSERAARRIAEILQAEHAALMRVSVEGGGCSGFQYRFDLVQDRAPDDIIIERDGARVVVDPVSLGFVHGSEIDFVDELIGAQFKINNPNVTTSCGCGTSFSI